MLSLGRDSSKTAGWQRLPLCRHRWCPNVKSPRQMRQARPADGPMRLETVRIGPGGTESRWLPGRGGSANLTARGDSDLLPSQKVPQRPNAAICAFRTTRVRLNSAWNE